MFRSLSKGLLLSTSDKFLSRIDPPGEEISGKKLCDFLFGKIFGMATTKIPQIPSLLLICGCKGKSNEDETRKSSDCDNKSYL